MERKVNEVFEDQGVMIQCVRTEDRIYACDHCYYGTDKLKCLTEDDCIDWDREDKTDVHFIKIENEPII